MVSYLAFDSRSTKELLSTKNEKYFDAKFPVFYKNEDQLSAIDVSLEMNQIRSVNMMIQYICKYQNSVVYSHLFENNLVDLVNKGVDLEILFNSSVFNHTFDFDEWPATNCNVEKMLAPYNKSLFKLRYEYPEIFKSVANEDRKKEQLALQGKFSMSDEKVFKIKYQLNLLTSMSEKNGQIMNAIAGSQEI
jgi:hypothetical protein